jgi:hypothetical protein
LWNTNGGEVLRTISRQLINNKRSDPDDSLNFTVSTALILQNGINFSIRILNFILQISVFLKSDKTQLYRKTKYDHADFRGILLR